MSSVESLCIVMVVVTLLLTQFNDSVQTTDESMNTMNYVLVDGFIPTTGIIPGGFIVSGSVIRCAAECKKLKFLCTAFIFQPSMSSLTCSQTTPAGIGSCQLMSFNDSQGMVLGPAIGCQRFYIQKGGL